MKKKCFLLLFLLVLVTGCASNKEKLEEYLKENSYGSKNNCYRKKIEEENSEKIIEFCLDKCSYESTDKTLNDYFRVDFSSNQIQYIYDYITYQVNIKTEEEHCIWQGEELDLNNSYCNNAKKAYELHYKILKEELDQAKINIKYVCK